MGESIERKDVSLAILVGGKGTRLGGQAKGNLKLAGRTLLDRQLDLAPLFSEVLLVGDDAGAYAVQGVRRVADVVLGAGAPAGVVSALAAARTPWVVIFACDQPGTSAAVVERFFEAACDSADAACFEDAAGRVQPFPGLYRASLAVQWKPELSSGAAVRALLRSTRLTTLALPTNDRGLGPTANVNTWDDAHALGIDAS